MKFTVIVNWTDRTDPSVLNQISWQEVINYLTEISALGWSEKIKSVIVQPTIPVDATTATQQHLTAEQLRSA
jgi:hypothetical protein